MEREKTPIGIFITLNAPTTGMITESATAGQYTDSIGNKYPKLQILTIEEIFNGKKPDIPQLIRFIEKRDLKLGRKTKQKKL